MLVCSAILASAPASDAHVLVFRAKVAGKFSYEDALGKTRSESSPATQSFLWFLDLDTDTWTTSSLQGTNRDMIQLEERSKTSTAPASKTFSVELDGGQEEGEHRTAEKFELYSNSRKFYYFYFQNQNQGDSGYDTGCILAQGSCRLNVNIGGGRTSPVPNDFTGSLTRGDGRKLGKGVLSFKYDPAITIAVNEYLKAGSIQSVKGSGFSESIRAATSWLVSSYLPGKGGYTRAKTP